jgi:Rrf2 family transcriptional regulator, iron-sulfur cluster assembly transcription factor
MIYSKTCEYAIRALTCLARDGQKGYVRASVVSEETGVPGPYVSKIFQSLARSKILKSRKGPAGGFAFRVKPQSFSLMNIVKAIDDLSPFEECLMGLNECQADNACPLHHIWEKAKVKIIRELENTTLTQMTKKLETFQYRGLKRARLNAKLELSLIGG